MTARIDSTFIKNMISPLLAKEESILWQGRPDALRVAMPMAPLVLGGLVLLVASSLFILAAFTGKGTNQWIPIIFGIPGSIFGLFLIAIPTSAYVQARRTLYAATSTRILITDERSNKSVESFPLQNLATVTRTTYGTKGNLVWDLISANSSNSATQPTAKNVQLVGIIDPLSVQHTIEEQIFKVRENV